MNQHLRKKQKRHFRHYTAAIAIFLIGSLLSIAAFRFYQHQDLKKSEEEFNHLADLRLYVAKDALVELKAKIDAIKQFIYASEQISEHIFHIFAQEFLNSTPHFISLGWLDPHQPMKNAGPSFLFGDLSHTNGSMATQQFRLTYLEQTGDIPLFDERSYLDFKEALEENHYSSQVSVLNHIDYKSQGAIKEGLILFEPIHNIHEKTHALRGTIIGVANWSNVIEEAKLHLEPSELTLRIYAISGQEEKLLFSSNPTSPNQANHVTERELRQQAEWTRSMALRLNSQSWKLSVSPSIETIKENQTWRYWEVPIIGMLISGLTGYYFFFIANRNIHIENEVEKRTAELVESNFKLEKEINERKRIEHDIIEKERYLDKRHQTFEQLAKFTFSELHNAIHEVVLRTATAMEIERASVWFYQTTDGESRLSCAGLYTVSTNHFSNHLQFPSLHYPLYFKALAEHSYLILPSTVDANLNDELASYLATFHIISKLDIPIVSEGKLLGILCCEETRQHRDWRLEDRHFGQSIGEVVAIMIEQSARRTAEKALQETNEKLRKAVEAAKAASEAKSTFLTTVSHELRTPLNAIIGFNQCILMGMDGPLNPQQTDTLKKIEKSSFHLLSLISDVLDLAKIEAHKMELEVAPHNIVEIIYACVEEIHPLAVQKHLGIAVEISHEPVIISIDKMRIRQVFLNLLSNAVKFTEKGTITITLHDSESHLQVNIDDTGIGLTPESLLRFSIPSFKPTVQSQESMEELDWDWSFPNRS